MSQMSYLSHLCPISVPSVSHQCSMTILRIGSTTYQKIIDNQRPPEPTEEWRKIIESVSISDQILENNQESLYNTSFSTNIQEDGIIHMKHHADDENGSNSHINSNSLNIVTNGRKDKVSQKKK